MVSWLKANMGNCVMDSCSSVQCQLETRFFGAASRLYAMHSDAQLLTFALSSPEHPFCNSLWLFSASPQDMSHSYTWLDLIQSWNVNIFQALCPVLCADVIKDLTRTGPAGIDSQRQLCLWISLYFEIEVLTFMLCNLIIFSVLETSSTSYLFLCSGSCDLSFFVSLGRWGGFKLLLNFLRFPSCSLPKTREIILPRWQVTGACATSKL